MIEVTIVGVMVIALTALAVTRRPIRLAQLAIAFCTWEATAVVATPGFGIQPYYFVGVAIFARLVWKLSLRGGEFGAHSALSRGLGLFGLLLLWGAVGAALHPLIFAGMPVYAPGIGIDSQVVDGTPLTHTTSQLAQVIYLALNVALVLYVAIHARSARDVGRLHRAFLVAGVSAIAIAGIQKFTVALGLPFPYDLIQNNPSLDLRQQITFQGVVRLSGTFPEASNLAVFGSGLLAYAFGSLLLGRRPTLFYATLTVFTAFVMLWTTSSTAYLMIGFVTVALFSLYVGWPMLRGRIRLRRGLWFVLLLLGGTAALAGSSVLRGIIAKAVLGKFESRSFGVRTSADLDALRILVDTWGLGIGLGSNRPSSFVTSLLSTLGLLGTALFVVGLFLIAAATARLGARAHPEKVSVLALMAIVIAKTLSSPDLSTASMWALIALCAASLSVASKNAGRRMRIGLFPKTHLHPTKPRTDTHRSPSSISRP